MVLCWECVCAVCDMFCTTCFVPERRLPFMDVLVRREQKRFTTSVDRKPTVTGKLAGTVTAQHCADSITNTTRKEHLFAAVPGRRGGELAGDLSEEQLSRASRQSDYKAIPEPPSWTIKSDEETWKDVHSPAMAWPCLSRVWELSSQSHRCRNSLSASLFVFHHPKDA